MRRGRALRRRTPLKTGDGEMKRSSLKPISDKRRERDAVAAAAAREHGGPFRAIIHGERCVVCNRTEAEAYEETGWGHQAHHAIRQEVLNRLGLEHLLWFPDNAVCVCEEPCHRQHSQRQRRILRSQLPARVMRFVAVHGLEVALEREYPE